MTHLSALKGSRPAAASVRRRLQPRPGQDPAAATVALRELAGEVDAAIAEVGSLARGTYPYVLTDQGLAAALALAARDAPVSATVVAESRRRYAADIETPWISAA